MKTHDVFGIQPMATDYSYIDRGSLDRQFRKLVERKQTHVAIRGASKSGKSWLRQKVVSDPLVVQCRLSYTTMDVYRDALAHLDIRLEVDRATSHKFGGRVSASGDAGFRLLAKVTGSGEATYGKDTVNKDKPVGKDVSDLRFVADLIRESGRMLVIEDFHYLPVIEQRKFAFDLKTLWDYRTFVVVIGVWISENMLITLNHDLSDRIEELSVTWSESELKRVFIKGCRVLNLRPTEAVSTHLAQISYESVGLLQKLVLRYLDELGIEKGTAIGPGVVLDDMQKVDDAAMYVAEQLNQLYQTFARRVCEGVRRRANATGIYAHGMAVIMAGSDHDLCNGMSAKDIHAEAHAREPRILSANLKSVLSKFAELQVDEDGRGLVLAYDSQNEKVSLVDRQLLLYRRYATVRWPWEELIEEADATGTAYG